MLFSAFTGLSLFVSINAYPASNGLRITTAGQANELVTEGRLRFTYYGSLGSVLLPTYFPAHSVSVDLPGMDNGTIFAMSVNKTSPQVIVIKNPEQEQIDNDEVFLGVATYSGSLQRGRDYGKLQATRRTRPGAVPQPLEGRATYESAIWNYNPVTKAITPTWINADGTSTNATVAVKLSESEEGNVVSELLVLADLESHYVDAGDYVAGVLQFVSHAEMAKEAQREKAKAKARTGWCGTICEWIGLDYQPTVHED